MNSEEEGESAPVEPALPEPVAISPHYTQLDIQHRLELDEKIAIFADRVRGWQLDIAERLLRAEQHAGFAALAIVFSYFEMFAKHQHGHVDRDPKTHFVEGARSVLEPLLLNAATGVTDAVLAKLYADMRCQLYHEGFTGEGIVLTGTVVAAELSSGRQVEIPVWSQDGGATIFVNPHVLVAWIQRHFSQYVTRLLNPANTDERELFERKFGGPM